MLYGKTKEIKVVGELIKNGVEDEVKKNKGFPDVALFQVYKKTPEDEDENKNKFELLYKVVKSKKDSTNLMKKKNFETLGQMYQKNIILHLLLVIVT